MSERTDTSDEIKRIEAMERQAHLYSKMADDLRAKAAQARYSLKKSATPNMSETE